MIKILVLCHEINPECLPRKGDKGGASEAKVYRIYFLSLTVNNSAQAILPPNIFVALFCAKFSLTQ